MSQIKVNSLQITAFYSDSHTFFNIYLTIFFNSRKFVFNFSWETVFLETHLSANLEIFMYTNSCYTDFIFYFDMNIFGTEYKQRRSF